MSSARPAAPMAALTVSTTAGPEHYDVPSAGSLPAGASSPGEQRGTLPAWSFGAPAWPEVPVDEGESRWRPALFVFELHRLGTGLILDFGGEPITGTECGRTAMVEEHARGGPQYWQGWPRCTDCAAHARNATRRVGNDV